MIQELFRIGDFAISPFGVMLVVALLAAYAQLTAEMRRMKIGSDDDASAIVVGCGLGGIVGGKIYYALLYRDWGALFDRAGIVWYGCFLAGLLVLLWTIRRRKLPMARVFDAASPALALGYGLGRIGCFLVGDDYGKPTDLPWAITIRPENRVPGYEEFSRFHPMFLYEMIMDLLICGGLIWIERRFPDRLRAGDLFGLYFIFYFGGRFFLEFLKLDAPTLTGGFTIAQGVSLLAVAGGVIFIYARHRLVARQSGSEPAR